MLAPQRREAHIRLRAARHEGRVVKVARKERAERDEVLAGDDRHRAAEGRPVAMPDVVMSSLYDVDEPELLVLPTLFPQLDDVVSTRLPSLLA